MAMKNRSIFRKIFALFFLALMSILIASPAYSKDTSESFETISTSNLDRLESIASLQPESQLRSEHMYITLAKDTNVALIENRLAHVLGSISIDQQTLGPTYPFVTDTVIGWTAISPNGKYAIVADHVSIEIWELESGKTIARQKLSNKGVEITSVLFFPKSDKFAYVVEGYPNSSPDEGIYIYDLATNQEIKKLDHPTAEQAIISPEGKYLVSSGFDGSLRLWDLQTYIFQEIRQANKSPINQVSFVDSDLLAVVINDANNFQNIVGYWNIKDKNQIPIIGYGNYIKDGVSSALSVKSNNDINYQLWNIAPVKNLALLQNESLIDISVKQNLLITSGVTETHTININFRELDTGKLLHTINKSNFSSALLSSDAKKLILWNQAGDIEIWGVRKQ